MSDEHFERIPTVPGPIYTGNGASLREVRTMYAIQWVQGGLLIADTIATDIDNTVRTHYRVFTWQELTQIGFWI